MATGMLAASPASPVTGFVQSVSADEITIVVDSQLLTLRADDKTSVWKGALFHDLTPLRAGDAVKVRFRSDFFGRLIATEIEARVRFTCTVRANLLSRLELAHASASQYSVVDITPATRFAISPLQIEPDDEIEVVGWDTGNGRVEAERISVYNLDAPVSRNR